jgi:hypothetical protein
MRLIQQVPESEFIREFLAADHASTLGKSECVRNDLASAGLKASVLVPSSVLPPEQKVTLRAILLHCHGGTLADLPLEESIWYDAELLASDDLYLMAYRDFLSWTNATLRPQDAIRGFRDSPDRSLRCSR